MISDAWQKPKVFVAGRGKVDSHSPRLILRGVLSFMGSPGGASGKEPAYQCRRWNSFDPWFRKIPWRQA